MKKLLKRLRIRNRAFRRGAEIIQDRPPFMWSKQENRHLIRLNRIKCGKPPFGSSNEPRVVGEVYECQVSLHSFGLVTQKPEFSDSIRDLYGLRRYQLGILK